MLSVAQLNPILTQYTLASRPSGSAALTPADETVVRSFGFPADVPLTHWTRADLARLVLLRELASTMTPGDFEEAALACFTNGDAGEQRSWCRAVSLFPSPDRFLPTVIDTCRTNILPLFEAIACENPYPARFFPELHFNQMVLKAMFNSVALARVVGLPERRNPELSRMSTDYAAERTAAGRAVPADIALAQ
jgi:hypothetical protein